MPRSAQPPQSTLQLPSVPLTDAEIYGKIQTKRSAPRIPFAALLENGLLQPGQALYLDGQGYHN